MVLERSVARTRTLTDKFRLILISVIVGFFVDITIGAPYDTNFNGKMSLDLERSVCLIEDMYMGESVKSAEETEVAIAGKERTLTTEEHVREFFAEVPVMVDIARCESNFRHYNSDGSVLRGMVNGSDVGVMQINKFYHGDRAAQLGIDLYSREGNMEYAMYLYRKQGTTPWMASRHCWSRELAQR